MSVISEAVSPPVVQPSATEYINASSHAVNALISDIDERGVVDILKLPSQEPSRLGLYKRGWTRGAQIDGYAYVAGSIVEELASRMPESSNETEAKAVHNIQGFYGQLGASILLRCLQKGTDAYIKAAEDPTIEECDSVTRRSFKTIVHPLAAQHNSIGSRLEVLYELTGRGNDVYDDFASSTPYRYGFVLENTPEPHVVLEDFTYALADAERYAELEPAIPRIASGICPLESPRTKVDQQHQTSLQALWNIAIEACKEAPWLWPEKFKHVDQCQERS